MIVQEMFGNGYAIIWAMLIVGLFVYGRSEVELFASGRNGVQMETMLSKTYSIFIIQIAVALSLIVLPVVQIFLGVHWFFIVVSTVVTVFLGLIVMLTIKDIVEKSEESTKKRRNIKMDSHKGNSEYKKYKLATWVWLILGLIFLGYLWFSVGRVDLSLLVDVMIVIMMVTYYLLYWLITTKTLYLMENSSIGNKSKDGNKDEKEKQ